jgi:hypothetical protein
LSSAYRERLERKRGERRRYEGAPTSKPTRPSEGTKLADVATVAQQLGRPPSAREVVAEGEYCRETYRVRATWDGVLRAAGVGAVVDHIRDWIADKQARPRQSAQTFRAHQVAADTGLAPQMVAHGLARLRDGHALAPADGDAFEGAVVTRSRSGDGGQTWGVER